MVGGYNYIVPAGDCTTKFQKIFLAKRKSEFGSLFIEFVNWAECQSGRRVKQVTMDNELRTNNQVIEFLKGKGIEVAWTAPGRSDENPFGEGSNSRIQQSIRVLLSMGCQPASMAGFAAQYAAYVQSRMLEADGTSRLEKLTGRRQRYDHCRVYGCLCIFHVRKRGGDYTSRGSAGTLVGISGKHYLILDNSTLNTLHFDIKRTNSVVFIERRPGWGVTNQQLIQERRLTVEADGLHCLGQ